jgi:amino acid transporter
MVSGVFALALAQIASAFRRRAGSTTGARSSGNRFTGWLAAWLNLLGLVTVLGAINVGTYYFFFGAFGAPLRDGGHDHQPRDLLALITGARRW